MKHSTVALLLIGSLVSGCNTYELAFDNPQVRSLQEASLAGAQSSVAGQTLPEFFAPRTGWILPEDAAILRRDVLEPGEVISVGGRAAAVSRDGYYLTAHHVVEGIDPLLVLTPDKRGKGSLRKLIESRQVVLVPGRIVRRFESADVSLVKFDHIPRAHFVGYQERPETGQDVFSACVDGYVIGENRLGNGPFQVRGQVLKVRNLNGKPTAHRIFTSIVARGGMSGAPVSDRHGALVGILVGGRSSRMTGRPISSICEMVSADEIQSAIAADRTRVRSSTTVNRPGRVIGLSRTGGLFLGNPLGGGPFERGLRWLGPYSPLGDAQASPPWPRSESLAAGHLSIFRQALSVFGSIVSLAWSVPRADRDRGPGSFSPRVSS